MKKNFCAVAMFLSFGMVSNAWAVTPVAVPEPSLHLLLGAGLAVLAAWGEKLKR